VRSISPAASSVSNETVSVAIFPIILASSSDAPDALAISLTTLPAAHPAPNMRHHLLCDISHLDVAESSMAEWRADTDCTRDFPEVRMEIYSGAVDVSVAAQGERQLA